MNSTGLCFDIVGALILFLQEEWNRLLEPHKDVDEFPSGPPSYVIRDWFDFEDLAGFWDVADEEAAAMAQYYHWQRGILLLVIGFALQLLAVWM